MPVFHKPARGRRAGYCVAVSTEGVHVEFDENFWDNTVVDEKGTTQLDYNIAQVLQEISAGLYFLGTTGTKH